MSKCPDCPVCALIKQLEDAKKVHRKVRIALGHGSPEAREAFSRRLELWDALPPQVLDWLEGGTLDPR